MQDINQIIQMINNSKIPAENKEFLIRSINLTNNSTALRDSEKARKIGLVINTFNAYLTERELNSLNVILRDTFKYSVDEILKPFEGAWSSVKFLTNPVVLVIILLIVAWLLFWFKVIK